MQKPKDPSLLKRDVTTVINVAGAIVIGALFFSIPRATLVEALTVGLSVVVLVALSGRFARSVIQDIYMDSLWEYSIALCEWREQIDVGDFVNLHGTDRNYKVLSRWGSRISIRHDSEVHRDIEIVLCFPPV